MNPKTTTAILIERRGQPEVLVEREVPLGEPAPGEVHLRVRAVGADFADRPSLTVRAVRRQRNHSK